MFWLKCCPRCGGLYDDRDQYGYYIACVQCGHYLT
jgi:DNA-directed RNA polymerase subunit RPC12/RpoP